MAPFKSTGGLSVGKLLGVFRDRDLTLNSSVRTNRYVPPPNVSGLLFWYDTTLHSSQQQIFDNATLLESGATIPASQYVYMTWKGVTATGVEYQFRDNFGMSVSSVSSPYIAIDGVGYPTAGSYGSSELPRCYLSDTNDYYSFKLYAADSSKQWGIMATSRNTTGSLGWGANGSITYTKNGLGV
jgi:hypothetical protein